ncbi:MAG: 4Fe-4S dicluster domain-containing protein [Polyangiaceae bacterium]|nr:4Fe-4S dicluster domain-containing protein [Polyangiaceae bacterium]
MTKVSVSGTAEPAKPRVRKEQKPGVFVPKIDRTLCEGGFHGDCAKGECPCISACPHGVLQIRPLTAEDKRALSFGSRFRAWIHRNRQAYVVKPDSCTSCTLCIQACPVPHVIKLKRRVVADGGEPPRT